MTGKETFLVTSWRPFSLEGGIEGSLEYSTYELVFFLCLDNSVTDISFQFNIMNIVTQMRKQRCGMIQTKVGAPLINLNKDSQDTD